MGTARKVSKTFSLDTDVVAAVKRTKGRQSESERVNGLLRFALELEKRADLSKEAAGFYSSAPDDEAERRAFENAGMSSWKRD